VAGVTPLPAEGGLRGVHSNPPAQALRSLAQSIYKSVRYNFLVVLFPDSLSAAQAFAKEVGIADVVLYRPRPDQEGAMTFAAGEKGIQVALIPAAPKGFRRVRVSALRSEERRYRLQSAEEY
jgi:hypothetical protein